MHIVSGTATIARFAGYRQQRYYPTGMKRAFGMQSKPAYYLVLGIIVALVGFVIGLAALRR